MEGRRLERVCGGELMAVFEYTKRFVTYILFIHAIFIHIHRPAGIILRASSAQEGGENGGCCDSP